jgi:ArsR family transcriptional regulator, arsenate/arsenite/antimonite-responsive transcriptional repressor
VNAQAQLAKPRGEARQAERPPRGLAISAADEQLAGFTRALGHPIRVAIVRYLLEQGESVCTDLSDVVPLAHSTTMQHIKVLKEAGLLSAGRCGRNVLYCVNPEALRQLRALVGRL